MDGTEGTPTGSSIGTTQSQLDPAAAMGVVPLAQPASTTATTADTAGSEQHAADSVPKRKNKSIACDHFTKLTNADGSKMDKPRAKCNYCPQTYYVHSKLNGTSSMRNHMLFACRKCPLYIQSKKQKHLVFDFADNGGGDIPMKGKLKDPASEDAKTEDDQDTSDTDDRETSDSDDPGMSDLEAEQNLGIHSQSAIDASICLSSFGVQLEHKLTEAEVENLAKQKWRYKWDVPAAGMSKGKWAGTGECCIKDVNPDSSYDLKQKLYKHWLDVYNTSGGKDFHSSRQRLFFSLFNTYRDMLHCNKKPFYHRGSEEDSSVMDAYIMHCLNHVFRTRDLVMKNDAKVAKHQENDKNVILTDDSLRDHGFTRPKEEHKVVQ